MMVKIKHISWRGGRPRFSPGPELRALGHRGRDLRHDDGRWFTHGEALDWSVAFQSSLPPRDLGPRKSPAPAEQSTPHRLSGGNVYFLWVGDAIKVGFSTKPALRLADLAVALSQPPRLFISVPGRMEDERWWHRTLAVHRLQGEWFRASFTVIRAIQRFLFAALDPRSRSCDARTISHAEISSHAGSLFVPAQNAGKNLDDQ